jgi:hypothetical protein
MKKISAAALVVFAVALCTFLSAPAIAQQGTSHSSSAVAQEPMVPPQGNPDNPDESKTFTGKIIQSGDKLVLTDATGETIYQLDDQVKAREFLNKNVKVTGILDVAAKMIRVSAIEPV